MRYLRTPIAVIVVLLVLTVFLPATPTYAATIAPPDAPSQVLEAIAYPGLLESGDLGVLVEYSIPYATLPSTIVTNAYTVQFIQADNVTQLAAVAPYTFVSSGYTTVIGRPAGIAWLYFSAAQVAAYSLTYTNASSYGIWIAGNPMLTWTGTGCPLTKSGLTSWVTTGVVKTQLGLKILDYADVLGTYWSLSLSQSSPAGTVLTTTGEQYFIPSITNLRTMCPQIFSAGSATPVAPFLNYDIKFGVKITNLTGTATGSPITVTSSTQNITVTAVGTFTAVLAKGTSGNATSILGGATVTGSPLDLYAGTNTITVTSTGNFTLHLQVVTTQSIARSWLVGTPFDPKPLADKFGLPESLTGGLEWLLVTILICAFVYGGIKDPNAPYAEDKSGKVVMLIFDICIIGGAVIGILPLLVAILMFIGFGALTGYVLFFRSSGA